MEKPPEPAPDEAAGGPAGGAPGAGHGIIIKPGDVKSVEIEEVSVRSGPTVQPLRIARFVEKRTSRMAVASLILGITGLFLAGVPGVFAAVTGAIALGAILNDRRLKGALWAVVGIGLGVTAVTGWLAVAILYFWAPERGRGSPPVQFAAGPALLRFDDAPPEIRKLLQASVHITGSSRAGLAGHREWLGSGVIYRSGGDEAILLTNRHVADPAFADGRGGDRAAEAELQVTYFSGETVKAKVDWIAPAGIDIALLRCPPPVGGATLVPFDPVRTVRISDMVFAIGNPEGLGWSYTQGPISGIRTYSSEGEEVIVLQTQAALNPGNSGGGLFDREGFLIGINTWTQDKRVAEGLNFAISMETVDRILRAAGKARQ
jgi:S1-C subfamily serine protease